MVPRWSTTAPSPQPTRHQKAWALGAARAAWRTTSPGRKAGGQAACERNRSGATLSWCYHGTGAAGSAPAPRSGPRRWPAGPSLALGALAALGGLAALTCPCCPWRPWPLRLPRPSSPAPRTSGSSHPSAPSSACQTALRPRFGDIVNSLFLDERAWLGPSQASP